MPHIRAAMRGALIVLPFATALLAPGPAQAAPSASFSFSPATPQTLEAVTFTSTSTGVVPPQRWDLDGDTVCDDASGAVVQRAFPVAAAYSVKLCVTDGVDEATATRRVTVRNRPPVASFAYAPPAPMTGDRVGFASTASDPDGPIVSEQWDLDGDGAFDDSGGTIASVTFTTPGPHIVRLVVTDRDGAVGVATAMITVRERPLQLLSAFPVVRMSGRVMSWATRVRSLTINTPPSTRVRVRCSGRGCPFRLITKRAAHASRLLTVRRLRGRLLRPGAVVKVWVWRPNRIGKYVRFRIRSGKPPKRADRCVKGGARVPIRCPSPTAPSAAR
jgi:PKD repeat protein